MIMSNRDRDINQPGQPSKSDVENELHTQIQYRLLEKLAESEKRYRNLIENLREIVFECDHNGIFILLNRAWTATLGYPVKPSLGKAITCFLAPEDREIWYQAMVISVDSGECCNELRFLNTDGEVVWLELSLITKTYRKETHFSGSLVDITERKKTALTLQSMNVALEERVSERTQALTQANQDLQAALHELKTTQAHLLQSEKMSGLGQLVAGLAHEINNPTHFIHGNIAHLKQYCQEIVDIISLYRKHYPEPIQEIDCAIESAELDFLCEDLPSILESIQTGTKRISEIIRSLRQFSRNDTVSFAPVNIHDALDSTLLILDYHISGLSAEHQDRAVEIIRDYGELPLVDGNLGQLNQVFMNIFLNAIDALEERAGRSPSTTPYPGQIRVQTRSVNDQWIEIAIADNGTGIPKELQSRIFDPFFTTKEVGKGTGMGISISYQIIADYHKGDLTCISEGNEGTEFVIRLPIQQGYSHYNHGTSQEGSIQVL